MDVLSGNQRSIFLHLTNKVSIVRVNFKEIDFIDFAQVDFPKN
jgi:hypothetical protein